MESLVDVIEEALELDRLGDLDLAAAKLDGIHDQLPEDAAYLKLVGLLYQRLGKDQTAYELLRRAEGLSPDDPEIFRGLGFHYQDNGAQAVAIDAFTKCVELGATDHDVYLQRGRSAEFAGRYAEAEEDFARAIERAPGKLEPHYHMGNLLNLLNRPSDALPHFEAAQAIDPDHILPTIGLRRAGALAAGIPEAGGADEPATVVCVKHGTKYGAEYVNRLASMVDRQASAAPRIICFTEDSAGISDRVEILPLPADNLQGWWNKVALFKPEIGVSGRVLYLDLDVVITNSLDPLLYHGGPFVIMDNDYVPGFNTSVMLFEAGGRPEIWETFTPEDAARLDGDQDWVSLAAPDALLWPHGWCLPYRLGAVDAPPPDARVIAFCGKPNPEDYPSDWIREYWR